MNRMLQRISLGLLLILLPGCTEVSMPVEHKKEPVHELTFWLFPGSGLEPLIEAYEQEHPQIRVHLHTSSYPELSNKLQTTLASGNGVPDIALVEISFMERFKELSGSFENLLDYGAGARAKEFLPWKWQQASAFDESFLLGLPTDIGPIAMAYRRDYFEQAGLPAGPAEVAAQMSSWDDFLDTADQIQRETGKYMIDNLDMLYRVILGQAEEQYYDKNTGELIVHRNPEVYRAWSAVMKAKEKGLTAGLPMFSPEWSRGLQQGEFAVAFAPSWMIDILKKNAPDAAGKWDMTFIPQIASNYGGSFLTLPKGGEHPQEAYHLIDWLTQAEQQVQLFKANGNFPSMPELFSDPVIMEHTDPYFNDAPTGQIYSQIASQIKPTYEGSDQFLIARVMFDVLRKVEQERIEPEEAWEIAMQQIQIELGQELP
ncbi:extracellular solute-binding protein family 1 [Paenibacillus algicola]|uniref:Extracellular solute-binding protein family 1 n=1 Tax=Paenibacillus algicola TaxID=2565926 RepID=A0A4P8XFD9_9BACL|nr:extracellular solute-binding protein [Paenibacillus algicola]QCT01086.1 extracellular solute-binding protein family 1 [Paenibacillus algicola]